MILDLKENKEEKAHSGPRAQLDPKEIKEMLALLDRPEGMAKMALKYSSLEFMNK